MASLSVSTIDWVAKGTIVKAGILQHRNLFPPVSKMKPKQIPHRIVLMIRFTTLPTVALSQHY